MSKAALAEAAAGLAGRSRQLMRFCATLISGLMLGLLLPARDGLAAETQPSQYHFKAAFLYHFAQFVDWPPTVFAAANSPLVIGILGENPFGSALEQTVRGKTLNAHPLVVREFRSPKETMNACHILFISSSEKKRLPDILADLRGAKVLTVGETERFIESGGMINFVLEGTKLRFQINNAAARGAGLKLSSKLLSLASPTPQLAR